MRTRAAIFGFAGRYRLWYAPESIVYHKHGAATGAHRHTSRRSALAAYYSKRNRVLITRRYFPYALPLVYAGLAVTALHRVLVGRLDLAQAIASAIFGRPAGAMKTMDKSAVEGDETGPE
ncbi:MAG: hypothetical protein WCF16_04140 [Alphaproteobacteria bacterium]